MSKSAQASLTEPAPQGQQVSFEEALKKLESIVEAMENQDLPLETLLARFEEGAYNWLNFANPAWEKPN